jgi:hypothetical protein
MNWGNGRESDKDVSFGMDVDSKQIYIWDKWLWCNVLNVSSEVEVSKCLILSLIFKHFVWSWVF